jgi:hypothetical protein
MPALVGEYGVDIERALERLGAGDVVIVYCALDADMRYVVELRDGCMCHFWSMESKALLVLRCKMAQDQYSGLILAGEDGPDELLKVLDDLFRWVIVFRVKVENDEVSLVREVVSMAEGEVGRVRALPRPVCQL